MILANSALMTKHSRMIDKNVSPETSDPLWESDTNINSAIKAKYLESFIQSRDTFDSDSLCLYVCKEEMETRGTAKKKKRQR